MRMFVRVVLSHLSSLLALTSEWYRFSVIIARSEPVCRDDERLPTAVDHSEVISVELPAQASADKKFLAFPPDGEYELWLLGERETVGQNLEDMGMDPILDEAVELDFKGHREVLLA